MITLHNQQRHQTIAHFGASGAWWAQAIGGWKPENRQRAIDLLFNPQAGIGLSLYRYNIGGGDGDEIADPWRRAECFEVTPGQYDWTRDANAVLIMREAQQAGVEQFVAFINSPPARMTDSGRVSGAPFGRSNLRVDMHEAFARYLVDVVQHLKEDEGIPIGWLSPINEPFWFWGEHAHQEGCHYTPPECVAVSKAVQREIEARNVDLKLSVIEAPHWRGTADLYMSRLLGDPELGHALGPFAIHSYWSTAQDKADEMARIRDRFPGLELWMSEWTEMRSGQDRGMDSALILARVIHEDLTIASVTSWQYWIAVSKYDFCDGLLYADEDTETVEETKRLWAMGNYSRFVRPGAVRIKVDCEQPDLLVSAFVGTEKQHTVLVAVNPSAVAVESKVQGTFGPRQSVYETSAAHDLAQVYEGKTQKALICAAESVTTVVWE